MGAPGLLLSLVSAVRARSDVERGGVDAQVLHATLTLPDESAASVGPHYVAPVVDSVTTAVEA